MTPESCARLRWQSLLMQWMLYDNRTYHACRFGGILRCNHPAGDVDRAGYREERQVTTTAHEDQFIAPFAEASEKLTDWARWAEKKRLEIDYTLFRENEIETIAKWIYEQGYHELATRIWAREYWS